MVATHHTNTQTRDFQHMRCHCSVRLADLAFLRGKTSEYLHFSLRKLVFLPTYGCRLYLFLHSSIRLFTVSNDIHDSRSLPKPFYYF